MYTLPEEIKRRLLRRYRKRSREIVVDDRYRGWAWTVPPIDPPYDILLPLSDIAARYCQSMRDIYLRHVEHTRKPLTAKMIVGKLYHETIAATVEYAKRMMYSHAISSGNVLRGLMAEQRQTVIEAILNGAGTPEVTNRGGTFDREQCRSNMLWLWDYETNQFASNIDVIRSMQPYIGLDSLVNTAIPVVVEQKLDGRNIGLSGHLSADALSAEGVVLDVKTGRQRYFHRLATTGYALVIESIYEYPVDIGCIVYCWFKKPIPPEIKYDVHQIDEVIRQEFLEIRDEAMKIVFDQRDPGLPTKCYDDCPYWDYCH